MRFSVGTGATESTGYFSYVRTADYQGKLVFTQRTIEALAYSSRLIGKIKFTAVSKTHGGSDLR